MYRNLIGIFVYNQVSMGIAIPSVACVSESGIGAEAPPAHSYAVALIRGQNMS